MDLRPGIFRQLAYSLIPTRGYWLPYSVGPDLHHDHARAEGRLGEYQQLHGIFALSPGITYDLVFPIPPLEGNSTE